jgi:hypothetical protein
MDNKPKAKSELGSILPEFVDESGKFSLPTSSSFIPEPNQSDRSGNVKVSWYEEPAAQAAIVGGGAATGYLGSKLLPPTTADARGERKLSNLLGQQGVVGRQLETARAPFMAAQGATQAAQMELARNRMLMDVVTQRAMQLGVDPIDFVKSPELFTKAMAPEAGYAGKNWVKAQYGNVNPILESRLVGTGGAKEMVENFMASAPRAQTAVGPTVQDPSGIIKPAGRSPEGTRAGVMVGNIDKTLQEAIIARDAAQAAEAAAKTSVDPRLQSEADKLERKVAGQRADMLAAAEKGPGAMDRMAKMLSGPKTSAGLGAISAYKLPQAYREMTEGDYKNALLHGLEGISGGLMLAPHPLVKAAGVAAAVPSFAYEYGPLMWEAMQKAFKSSGQKK